MNILSRVKIYNNFPKKGIKFYDLNPVYKDAEFFSDLITMVEKKILGINFDYVIGIEARGFILGSAIASRLGKGFIPIRKPNKLPGLTFSCGYGLEYGEDSLQIQKNQGLMHKSILLVDDVLATGGTLRTATKLLELCRVKNVIALTILNLDMIDPKSLGCEGYFQIKKIIK